MPAAGYTVGLDIKLVLVDQNTGAVLSWPVLSSADFKQMTKALEWKPLNGNIAFAELPGGWEVSFEVERTDGSVMDYFVISEAAYLSGGPASQFYLQQTVNNPDGSATQYRYINGAMKLSNAGAFKMDDKVSLKIDGRFGRCLKVTA